ncbi:substrate-binding domain-containing protein [uncultured Sphaerochaeta sp.]|uniref:LacI family DNA-binding transcriptional regulator n=1 Tax=uncultured Sphaerochaeta sp. TaxID=886478 RepID=UPI002A0A3382|nr:substrate-binding domain-containing protein [uncultured Sphaerochaeta sp.]
MGLPVTISDIAKKTRISPITQPTGEKRIQGKQEKQQIIGCLAADITEGSVSQIIRGIEQILGKNGGSLFMVSGVEFGQDLKKAYGFLKSHALDGILLCHHMPFWQDFANDLKNTDVPLVSIGMEVPEAISVLSDNKDGGYLAADHLYTCGMRHPAMLCGPKDRFSVQERLKGFKRRVRELGLAFDEADLFFGPYDFEHGYISAKELLDTHPLTDGIFCANDYIAAGVITRLQRMHIEVPRQVQVLGFDNRDFAAFWATPISTLELPLEKMGRTAMELLQNSIDTGTYVLEKQVLPPSLIPRASTRG